MLGLLDLRLWAIWALVTSIASGFCFYKGYHQAELEHQAQVAELNEKARVVEHEHAEAVNRYATQLEKANEDAKTLQSNLLAGAVSMSIPTDSVCPAASAPAATGDRNKARAKLDRQAAQTLVTIAGDGDAAIRQLNACIDAYNTLRGEQ